MSGKVTIDSEVLNEVMDRLGYETDTALAADMGLTSSALSRYRSGQRYPGETFHAWALANVPRDLYLQLYVLVDGA